MSIKKEEERLEVTLCFSVKNGKASDFVKLLVARMHKYLMKHAVTITNVDTKIL